MENNHKKRDTRYVQWILPRFLNSSLNLLKFPQILMDIGRLLHKGVPLNCNILITKCENFVLAKTSLLPHKF